MLKAREGSEFLERAGAPVTVPANKKIFKAFEKNLKGYLINLYCKHGQGLLTFFKKILWRF